MRSRLASLLWSILVITVSRCPAQSVQIQIPDAIPAQTILIRYCVTGVFGGHCAWIRPRPEVATYRISTVYFDTPVEQVRGFIYAPGCTIETFAFTMMKQGSRTVTPAREGKNPQYAFRCQPLPATSINGVLKRPDRLYGRSVELRTKYIAYWAPEFLGVNDGVVITIPVGEPSVTAADNHFHLSVPDLSRDPVAGAADHAGAFQIWAFDKDSGQLVAILALGDDNGLRAKLGGLKIASAYPPDLVFAPCSANPPLEHDSDGFAIRPDVDDACDPR
jgi:hypothetical protein